MYMELESTKDREVLWRETPPQCSSVYLRILSFGPWLLSVSAGTRGVQKLC